MAGEFVSSVSPEVDMFVNYVLDTGHAKGEEGLTFIDVVVNGYMTPTEPDLLSEPSTDCDERPDVGRI